MKKTESREERSMSNERQVSFHGSGIPRKDDYTSSSATGLPSLHKRLMRTHEKRDPFQYYEVLKILGDGSMGSVCKVKKKRSAVGGSARKAFLEMQKRSSILKILPCLSFCIPGDVAEESKKGALVAVDVDDPVENQQSRNSEVSNSCPSSIVSFQNEYGVLYALKSIILDHVTNDTFVRELQNEITILRTLDHPNICKAIETYEYRNQLYLVLELCSGGDLYSRDPYDEAQARHIVHSILDACAFLHRRNITHRDCKSSCIRYRFVELQILLSVDLCSPHLFHVIECSKVRKHYVCESNLTAN